MKLSFRQGIVNHQITGGQQGFLRLESNGAVSIIVDTQTTTVTFAHGDKNYSYTEPRSKLNAWGPLPDINEPTPPTYWLYWDISLTTGLVSYGYTTLEPITSVSTPTTLYRNVGRMWWNPTNTTMYYWNGAIWVECVRVFAAKLVNGITFQPLSILAPLYIGSQVGLTTSCYSGALVFDESGKPIRTGNGRKLFTTEDIFTTGVPTSASIRIESLLTIGEAMEPLAPYQVVMYNDFDRIVHAEPFAQGIKFFGIIEQGLSTGETGWVVSQGLIFNENWDWNAAGAEANNYVYISDTGSIVLTPTIADQNPVGIIIGKQTIFFDPTMFIVATGGGGVVNHGQLTGLADDDHLQYFNQTRGDLRYALINHTHSLQYSLTDVTLVNPMQAGNVLLYTGTHWSNQDLNHTSLDGLLNDDHPQYFNQVRGDIRYSQIGHIHDDRYYREDEIDVFLAGKANLIHTHLKADILDFAHTHPLVDITDVNLNLPLVEGQVLAYSSGTAKWINQTLSVGEVNTGANLGVGTGIFANKTGNTLNFKSLIAGTNVTISSDANTVTINSTAVGGGGVEYLADLLDVDVTNLEDKTVLGYDDIEGKWRPMIVDVGDLLLSGLQDVDVYGLGPNDFLRYREYYAPEDMYTGYFIDEPGSGFVIAGDVTNTLPPVPFTILFDCTSFPGCNNLYTVSTVEFDISGYEGNTVLFVDESPPGVCPDGSSSLGNITVQGSMEKKWTIARFVQGAGIIIEHNPEEVRISQRPQAYDIATNYVGAPNDDDIVLTFASFRTFTLISEEISQRVIITGYANTPPSSTATFTIYRGTTSIGTFTWSTTNVITSNVIGLYSFFYQPIIVKCTTANGIADFGFTIAATVPATFS